MIGISVIGSLLNCSLSSTHASEESLQLNGNDGNFLGFEKQLLTNCLVCLNCQERFAQTGAGWVLREMSKGNSQLIKHTLEDDSNLRVFTSIYHREATDCFQEIHQVEA